jgi:uncharacterized protein YciI
MQFLIKAYDGEGMLEKRMEVRPRHLEGMKALGKQIIVIGVAAIVPHNAIADSLMEEISQFVENASEAEVLEETREIR